MASSSRERAASPNWTPHPVRISVSVTPQTRFRATRPACSIRRCAFDRRSPCSWKSLLSAWVNIAAELPAVPSPLTDATERACSRVDSSRRQPRSGFGTLWLPSSSGNTTANITRRYPSSSVSNGAAGSRASSETPDRPNCASSPTRSFASSSSRYVLIRFEYSLTSSMMALVSPRHSAIAEMANARGWCVCA